VRLWKENDVTQDGVNPTPSAATPIVTTTN
jgi:hypothetical protein